MMSRPRRPLRHRWGDAFGTERNSTMTSQVLHFEIIGTDPEALRGYYGALFGWEFQVGDPATDSVSEPGSYGYVAADTAGVNGGVGGGPGHRPRVLFYVGV